MIWTPLALISVLVCLHLSAQPNLGGSYHLGAICKDGIVIGTDSRGNLFYNAEKPLAYFDTVQKVFAIKHCILSIVGLIGIQNKFLWSYLEEFKSTIPDDIAPTQLLQQLYNFVKEKYPTAFKDYIKLHMICAGYVNGVALMCAVNGESGNCAENKGIARGDTLSLFSLDKKYTDQYCLNRSCAEVGHEIEKAILDYPKRHHCHDKIGGPVMLLMVSKTGTVKWLKGRPPAIRWKTIDDFWSDFKRKKVTIHFEDSSYKKKMYQQLNIPLK